jgi:hypothetical protein
VKTKIFKWLEDWFPFFEDITHFLEPLLGRYAPLVVTLTILTIIALIAAMIKESLKTGKFEREARLGELDEGNQPCLVVESQPKSVRWSLTPKSLCSLSLDLDGVTVLYRNRMESIRWDEIQTWYCNERDHWTLWGQQSKLKLPLSAPGGFSKEDRVRIKRRLIYHLIAIPESVWPWRFTNKQSILYTKAEAMDAVSKRICDGMREDDHEWMKSSGKPFRTLREDSIDEYGHGWIFSCPATYYTKEGKREYTIGGGLRVAFNRENGKIQKLESGFSEENFKRTGDIHRGCNDHSLIISCYVDPWAESEEPNIVARIWAMTTFKELLMTHTDMSAEQISELVERFFTPKKQGDGVCLDSKSESDANDFVEGIVKLNEQAIEQYDYFGFEIHCISYSQVRKYGGYSGYIASKGTAQGRA